MTRSGPSARQKAHRKRTTSNSPSMTTSARYLACHRFLFRPLVLRKTKTKQFRSDQTKTRRGKLREPKSSHLCPKRVHAWKKKLSTTYFRRSNWMSNFGHLHRRARKLERSMPRESQKL